MYDQHGVGDAISPKQDACLYWEIIKASCLSVCLFDDEDKITKEDRKRNNLFYLLKDSIVGGPSIIFNRYHQANKTYIRNLDKLCKTIIGYDANTYGPYLQKCQQVSMNILKPMI